MITASDLFDYQWKALNLTMKAFETRAKALVVMATGLGKTIVSAFWAKSELKKKHRGLFLCHKNNILEQAIGEFRKVIGNDAKFCSFFGSDKDFDADKADIVFASFQTYANWKDAFFENEFDFIIIDESHHGQAPTFKEVIQYFKTKKILGITATPDRMDMKDIRDIFGEEVVNYTLEEAIAKGWLTQVEYHILNDKLSHWKLKKIIKDVLEEGQRVSVKQINESIFIKKRDEEIARTIQEYAGTSKKVIIFCEKTDHADNFQKYLPGSLAYHSKVKGGEKENRKRLDAFREGSLQHILAVDKFNEGIDVPDAEVIVFLRCTDSKTIFFQQLGRGLRKIFGKEKVIVLDFVANCERLAMVKEMAHRVKEFAGNNFVLSKELLHVSGSSFDFVFSDEQVEILNLVKRINEPFYETWQEASRSAMNLKIMDQKDYVRRYKEDARLPSNPNKLYKDFPGFYKFLGTNRRSRFYSTWQEASAIVVKAGIKGTVEYEKNCKSIDRKLPTNPRQFYKDFPSWSEFIGEGKYKFFSIWQEASEVVKRAELKTSKEYREKRKIVSIKLPSNPHKFYKDFPGWYTYLGKIPYYSSWKQASEVAIKLGFNNRKSYRDGCINDPKLPLAPNIYYRDFPGWVVFLGYKKKVSYSTWRKASRAILKLGIRNSSDYKKRYKCDPELPASLHTTYKNFPGWRKFVGKGDFYSTWKKASKAALRLGINSFSDYGKKYKRDLKLPSSLCKTYDDFPGWSVFLKKKEFYKTWQKASSVAIKAGLRSSVDYRKLYKEIDQKLPCQPKQVYKDFPGWKKFLGKE